MSEKISLIDKVGGSNDTSKKWTLLYSSVVGIIVIVAVAVTLAVVLTNPRPFEVVVSDPSSESNSQCAWTEYPVNYDPFYGGDDQNTMEATADYSILLKNGTIWKATGDAPLVGYDLLMTNGKIAQIGQNIQNTMGATEFYLNGKWVTPGLVDTHSHLGVYAFPEDAWATQDGNELTDPVFPQLRAIDGLNPNDPAIPLIRSGGVTTSLVLPGSGNVQGGQAAYVKLRDVDTVGEMLLANAPRALKMACGENPKRVYGSMSQTPDSRLGIGWLQRKQWYAAAQLKAQQDQWQCAKAAGQVTEPYPEDISLEPLVAVLRDEARLMVHCYKVEDFEMMFRTANEFGFKIATYQHALEAWKIPGIMAANNVTIATFADNWGFKMEGFDASVKAPWILKQNGVNLALKSDHPVIFAKYLIYEAAKAHHYGLDAESALQAVTIAPAIGMGISSQVGTLELQKDADVVVWDRYPLQLDAQADKVFIDGQLVANYNLTQVPPPQPATAVLQPSPNSCPSTTSSSYAVVGATVYTMTGVPITNATIVVQNGNISCLQSGAGCSTTGISNVFTLNGGIIIPGMINTAAPTGQMEVESEDASGDGVADVVDGENIKAIDGIQFNTWVPRHLAAAWSGGITTIVACPMGRQLVAGLSVAFHSRGVVIDDALVKDEVSLDISIGDATKGSGSTSSVSGQVAQLRSLFKKATNDSNLYRAIIGEIPVVAHVQQADQISALIRLKKEFGFNLIIQGGAEAHLVANLLSSNNVPVIWVRVPPSSFETWHATVSTPVLLANAGVKVAIAVADPGAPRNLRWEAGFAVSAGLNYEQAIAAITSVPAQLYGLPSYVGTISQSTPANFVAFNGDPLALNSQIQLIALGTYVQCNPQQY